MKRFLTIAVIGCIALCITADAAVARGRRHHHGRHGTRLHVGFFFTSPVYPAPSSWYRPHHYGPYPHRPHRVVLTVPVVIWSGLSDYDRTLASHSTYYALEYMRSGDAIE